MVTPGFSADCLETLEEIAQENAEIFMHNGGEQFSAIPCLNDSDAGMDVDPPARAARAAGLDLSGQIQHALRRSRQSGRQLDCLRQPDERLTAVRGRRSDIGAPLYTPAEPANPPVPTKTTASVHALALSGFAAGSFMIRFRHFRHRRCAAGHRHAVRRRQDGAAGL